MDTDKKIKWGIRGFGLLIAVVCIAGLVYSLFRPMTSGPPLPPDPWNWNGDDTKP